MKDKAKQLISQLLEVEEKLGDPNVTSNAKAFKELSQRHSYLTEVKECFESLEKAVKEKEGAKGLLTPNADPDILEMAEMEVEALSIQIDDLSAKLQNLLIPPDPLDHQSTILELRAGTGGDEAALFVGDCVRMYNLFAQDQGWSVETLSFTDSDAGGYKEYVMVLSGKNVYRFLRFEAGTHRVQRVPETESSGRVHTSAITVAVLVEPAEEEQIVIDPAELRIDTYRASGAGGQHVNTTDSAVRITHVPTNTIVYCQQERSQHKNKEKAMRLLHAKLRETLQKEKQDAMSSARLEQIGSGDRSERIRTYNYPQNRVTDHRIDLTVYKLETVMQGHLEWVVQPLVSHFYQQQLDAVDQN